MSDSPEPLCDGQHHVSTLAHPQSPAMQSNTHLGVVVKVFYRCDYCP